MRVISSALFQFTNLRVFRPVLQRWRISFVTSSNVGMHRAYLVEEAGDAAAGADVELVHVRIGARGQHVTAVRRKRDRRGRGVELEVGSPLLGLARQEEDVA